MDRPYMMTLWLQHYYILFKWLFMTSDKFLILAGRCFHEFCRWLFDDGWTDLLMICWFLSILVFFFSIFFADDLPDLFSFLNANDPFGLVFDDWAVGFLSCRFHAVVGIHKSDRSKASDLFVDLWSMKRPRRKVIFFGAKSLFLIFGLVSLYYSSSQNCLKSEKHEKLQVIS